MYSCIHDGFDHYNTTGERWDTVHGTIQYGASYARFAAAPNCVGQGCRLVGGPTSYKIKNYNANVSQPIASFAVMFETITSYYNTFLQFLDNGTCQISLGYTSSGQLVVYRGNGATALGSSSPGVVTGNTWYFIDIAATIGPGASGSVSVHLSTPKGGSALIAVTGVNTSSDGNAWVNQVMIGDSNQNNDSLRFDDFHAHDASGSAPNSILGEGTRIYTKMPNGPGALTNWEPNGASANWQCVDEVPPDMGTTYVSAPGLVEDNYAVGEAGFTGTVNGLVRRSLIQKTDAGAHTFQNGVRSVGVDQFGAAATVLSSWAYVDSFSSTDPSTSEPWTASGADAASMSIYGAS